MAENLTRKALKAGEVVTGTFVREFASPEVARILDAAGFDFFILDNEHNAFTERELIDIARVSKFLSITCLVRVPGHDYAHIAKTLDLGAEGVIVPRIRSKQEVERVVDAARYAPLGGRGVGFRAVNFGYTSLSTKEKMKLANENTLIVIQIETEEALKGVDEIVSVPGIDVALIGPTDLSVALGVSGDSQHKSVGDATLRVISACENEECVAGIVTKPKGAANWKKQGISFLVCSNETVLLLQAAKDALNITKAEIE